MEVFDALARARADGARVALVTVVSVAGDAPSHPGAKLVVGADGSILAGTLGCSEFDVAGTGLAVEALAGVQPQRRTVDFSTHERERVLELFAEPHEPEPAVLVLGSNSIARAVAEVARTVGRRVLLVAIGGDAAAPAGVEVKADDPVRHLLAAPPGAHDAVVLSDHESPWVDEALRVALASEAFYVGMLGSRRHAPAAVRRLRDQGVPPEHLARLRSPVGLDIGSRSAAEIALSIVAEILAVERGATGAPMALNWSEIQE